MNRILLTALLLFTTIALRAENPAAALPAAALAVGAAAPDVTLRTEKDAPLALRKAVAEKPAVLIFYRGGWCPFCTKHLAALAGIEKDLAASGFQLLAISPDAPAKLREKPSHQSLGYTLLSDSTMVAARAFGIAFTVPDEVREQYKGFGINLEAESGQAHHQLPHPAVFVVDKAGIIRFAHVNPDYKTRLEPAKILEAVRAAKP